MMTATDPNTSDAKCSASASSAWLLVSRAVRCSARARQKLTAISTSRTTNGTADSVGGGRAVAQMAPGLDHDAAGQHIEHRDHAERRQALDLAVAVVMFLVGGRSETRTTSQVMTVATRSTEQCSASEISARLPMATPTTNLIAAMLALAKIEIAAARDFAGDGSLMGAV